MRAARKTVPGCGEGGCIFTEHARRRCGATEYSLWWVEIFDGYWDYLILREETRGAGGREVGSEPALQKAWAIATLRIPPRPGSSAGRAQP